MNQEARVLVSYGSQGVVELPDGGHAACSYRRSVGRPYCGDRVRVEPAGDQSLVVCEILERRNVFARADARRRKQVIAANLDQVLIVLAPAPEPSRDLIERYLVAVHGLGIRPAIVLNKQDLAAERRFPGDHPLGRLGEYRELGYDVVATSCKADPGVEPLRPLLRGRTSILVGQSGVGKSSLVNALLPDLDLQTGELSRATGKGTHTTTTTIMYRLAFGGQLVDSPGVWEYGLWEMDQAVIADGFIEFRPFIGTCRFNDCRHAGEPDCAVEGAMRDGRIREWRFEAYRRLLDQET